MNSFKNHDFQEPMTALKGDGGREWGGGKIGVGGWGDEKLLRLVRGMGYFQKILFSLAFSWKIDAFVQTSMF